VWRRLKQQYICPKDNNEVVGRDETVKGYEFAKDQYVVFSAEEIKAVEEKATNMIDVIEFIPLAQVQREYMEKVYYLGPTREASAPIGSSARRSCRRAARRSASTPRAASRISF
jgi:DNA end-binding protein Ku